jgi:hypothetical protein
MATHMLDATGDRDVVGAKSDTSGQVCHRSHRTSTHPIHRLSGDSSWKTSQDARRATDRHSLITDLGGSRNRHVINAVGWQLWIPTQQFVEGSNNEVVRPRLCVDALLTRPSEGGSNRIHQNNIAHRTCHRNLRN